MPYFSVVIPTYNRQNSIHNSIDAVLRQTFLDFELIIVDDGSTDNTICVIKSFKDSRIKYYKQENLGVCSARNNGALQAKCKYIVFLDSDDSVSSNWLYDFYDTTLKIDADIITCDVEKLMPNGKRSILRGDKAFLSGAFVLKNSIFKICGGYDGNLKYGENTELKWRLDNLINSRKHINSVNLTYNASVDGGRSNLNNRINSFYYLKQKHANKFADDPILAQTYYQIAGIDCIKAGRVKEGKNLLIQAFFIKPFTFISFLRVVIAHIPLLRNRWK